MVRRTSSRLLIPSYSHPRAHGPSDAGAARPWNGLVGLWAPELGPCGGRLWDHSGYANHGTLANMDPASDWVASPAGWMLDYDGVNDYVDCGSGAATNLTGDFTLSVWASSSAAWNPANYRYRPMATRNHVWQSGYGLHVYERPTPAEVRLEAWSRGTSLVTASYTVTSLWVTGRVYHAAAVLAGTTLLLYWDGRQVASAASAVPPASNTGPLRIGHGNSASYLPWPGRIGSVAVWKRGLTATEIRRLYEDPGVLVRAGRRRVCQRPWLAPVLPGPYRAEAGEVFVSGHRAGQVQSTGAAAGEVSIAGVIAGQIHG